MSSQVESFDVSLGGTTTPNAWQSEYLAYQDGLKTNRASTSDSSTSNVSQPTSSDENRAAASTGAERRPHYSQYDPIDSPPEPDRPSPLDVRQMLETDWRTSDTTYGPAEQADRFGDTRSIERHRNLTMIARGAVEMLGESEVINRDRASRGYDLPDDDRRRVERVRDLERRFQQAADLGQDRNSPEARDPVQALVSQINTELRAQGSPHVLMPIRSDIQRLPESGPPKGSEEFRGYQLVDINTGQPVERFDLMTNPRFQEMADRVNQQIAYDGTFGDDANREGLRDQLREIFEQYGMTGVRNFVNRLHHNDYSINIMDSNRPGEFGGISLNPRQNQSTFADVVWVR